MIIDDEFGDEVELKFHGQDAVEISILSGDAWTRISGERVRRSRADGTTRVETNWEGAYLGGMVLNEDAVRRLVTRLSAWLQNEAYDEQ